MFDTLPFFGMHMICMHVIFDLVVEVTIMVAAFGVVGVGADEGEGVVK